MRRVNVFAAVVAVLVAGGCNGDSDQGPDSPVGTGQASAGSQDTAVYEIAGDSIKAAHVRVAVVCAKGQVSVNIRGWTVVVPRGAEVKWHLAGDGISRVEIQRKDTVATSWGLDERLPLTVNSGDSISGGRAQTAGTWRYNLRYECPLRDSTYGGLIDPEVIIVPGTRLAAPEE